MCNRFHGTLIGSAWLNIALLTGCSTPAHQGLIGTWQSDVERTIESMRQNPDIPDATRTRLEDDYYGHVTIEYREDTVRAWFDNADYDTGFQPYEVVSVDGDRIVTREWNEILQSFETSTTWIDDDCIYGLSAEFSYREYYCRVE